MISIKQPWLAYPISNELSNGYKEDLSGMLFACRCFMFKEDDVLCKQE